MKRKLSLILSLVLVLTLVMTGCGKSEEPKPANGGDEKTEESAEMQITQQRKRWSRRYTSYRYS